MTMTQATRELVGRTLAFVLVLLAIGITSRVIPVTEWNILVRLACATVLMVQLLVMVSALAAWFDTWQTRQARRRDDVQDAMDRAPGGPPLIYPWAKEYLKDLNPRDRARYEAYLPQAGRRE